MNEKKRQRKLKWQRTTAEIGRVLMHVWDPIGVGHDPHAEGEYDCYVGPIFRLLTTGASDDEIAEHLWQIYTVKMELDYLQKEAMYPTVAALRQIPLPESQSDHEGENT
jgi:hypothetical protein